MQGRARQAQYRLICHQKGKYQVKAMCSFFGISRAAYYAWVKRLEWPDPDVERMEQVQYAYETSHRTYGYRRITLWLRKQPGVSINHKAVLRLMRKLNIRSVARKRRIFRERAEIHHHPDLAIAGIMLLWNVSSPI